MSRRRPNRSAAARRRNDRNALLQWIAVGVVVALGLIGALLLTEGGSGGGGGGLHLNAPAPSTPVR